MGEVFQKNSRPSFMKEIWDPKCLQFFDTIGNILYIYKMFNTFLFSVFQIFTRIELTLGETSIWKKKWFSCRNRSFIRKKLLKPISDNI